MVEYTPEGKGRDARRLSEAQLAEAFAAGSILESTALAFDRDRQLVFELAGHPARMPHDECAAGVAQGAVRDVALLTRVGRPTCFVVLGVRRDEQDRPYLALSRARAQRRCRRLIPRIGRSHYWGGCDLICSWAAGGGCALFSWFGT